MAVLRWRAHQAIPYRQVRIAIAAASQWAKQLGEDVEPACSTPAAPRPVAFLGPGSLEERRKS